MNERRRTNVYAECLDMFVSLRTLPANLLERRAYEPKADPTSHAIPTPIMSCMRTWDGLSQHDQGDQYYTNLILDSGNAHASRKSRPWKWAQRERHAPLVATFAPQENFRGPRSAGTWQGRRIARG